MDQNIKNRDFVSFSVEDRVCGNIGVFPSVEHRTRFINQSP
jgi:hypothetical protein